MTSLEIRKDIYIFLIKIINKNLFFSLVLKFPMLLS